VNPVIARSHDNAQFVGRSASPSLYPVFEERKPQISGLLLSPILHRNIVAVDVPVWRDGKVVYDLAASLPLSTFTDMIMRQRPKPDWTIAIFDREGTAN
jgi:hypothetical protein